MNDVERDVPTFTVKVSSPDRRVWCVVNEDCWEKGGHDLQAAIRRQLIRALDDPDIPNEFVVVWGQVDIFHPDFN